MWTRAARRSASRLRSSTCSTLRTGNDATSARAVSTRRCVAIGSDDRSIEDEDTGVAVAEDFMVFSVDVEGAM